MTRISRYRQVDGTIPSSRTNDTNFTIRQVDSTILSSRTNGTNFTISTSRWHDPFIAQRSYHSCHSCKKESGKKFGRERIGPSLAKIVLFVPFVQERIGQEIRARKNRAFACEDRIIRTIRARKNRARKNRARKNRARKNRDFACEDRVIRAIRARKNHARKNRAFACEDRIIRAVRA